MSEWIDISMPITADITGWPGDPSFSLLPVSRIAKGDLCNLTAMNLSCHTGTHCDAPWHFVDNGPTLEQVPHDRFFGPALVIDTGDVRLITADLLPDSPCRDGYCLKPGIHGARTMHPLTNSSPRWMCPPPGDWCRMA